MDVIYNHRSIRKYKSDTIPQDIEKYILEAGIRASTTGNMQLYSIIATTSVEIKEQLYQAHFKQAMVNTAPLIVTVCADFNRFDKWCEMRNAQPCYDNFLSFFTASIDALLVAQNIAIAAESKGLGICYVGTTTYMTDKIIDILHLPKKVIPVTTLVIGFAEEVPPLTDRLPLDAVLHHNTYTDYSDADIENYYSEKENLDFYKNIVITNNKETLAQVFTDIRYKKSDNLIFSQNFLKTINNQGFMNNE